MQPYTEAANKITTDIDISKPAEIVEKLKQCDFEMFQPCGLTEPVKVSICFCGFLFDCVFYVYFTKFSIK